MPKVVRTQDPAALSAEVFSIRAQDDPVGSIGMPVRDHLNAATATALITSSLSGTWIPGGGSVDVNICQGNVLTSQRNEIVLRMRGDWLFFIDDDMVWQPAQLAKLIEARDEHDLDILGGLCFRRAAPYQPTALMREQPNAGNYTWLEKWKPDDIVEVDATGMAFVLIHKRVFEGIVRSIEHRPDWKWPPIEERNQTKPPNFFRWEGIYGEDIRFCQDAKRSGYRVWVHTGVEVEHVSEVRIGRKDFLRELAMRPPDVEADRREFNERLGLETMSRDEAREALGW